MFFGNSHCICCSSPYVVWRIISWPYLCYCKNGSEGDSWRSRQLMEWGTVGCLARGTGVKETVFSIFLSGFVMLLAIYLHWDQGVPLESLGYFVTVELGSARALNG